MANKWQREVQRLEKVADKQTQAELYKVYNDLLIDLQKNIREYVDEFDNLPAYRKAQLYNLDQLQQQVIDIINDKQPVAEAVILDHETKAMVDGYYHDIYQVEETNGLRIDFSPLDNRVIAETVNSPVDMNLLSERLYNQRKELAERTNHLLATKLAQGKSYAQIAKNIKESTEASFYQANRIARTEGGRVRSIAKLKAQDELISKGIDIEKMWLATLDTRTRNSHGAMDGQTVAIDEKFESPEGHTTDAPRLFQVAAEDIHCRCSMATIVKGYPPMSRRYDNKAGDFITYKEWQKIHNLALD